MMAAPLGVLQAQPSKGANGQGAYQQVAQCPPASQTATLYQARPGETCTSYHSGCLAWCANNMSGQQGCLDYCREQFATCQSNGQWSMDQGKWTIIGLPRK
jgi:hypothetical protein